MAQPVVVQCEACGRAYSARSVAGEIVIATDDGRCRCGGDSFVSVETVAGPDGASG